MVFKILPEGKPPALHRPDTIDRTPPGGTGKKNTGKPVFEVLFLNGKPVADPFAVLLDAINDVGP